MNTSIGSVLTVVTLFFLGLISPGPNFLVVVQTTLRWGRIAGFLTGMGAATGDALYAACGLFGVAQVIETGGRVMMTIKFLGGLYLLWIGAQMLLRRAAGREYRYSPFHTHSSPRRHFARGLATDLANPKTIVFFASIFAVTVQPGTPQAVRLAMLFGIVLTSIAWRLFLAIAFSTQVIRAVYQRSERWLERVFGAALCLFGVHLVKKAALP